MSETSWAHFVKKHMGRDNQSQVAAKLGVSGSTVGRWMTGTTPDPSQVLSFARQYGASSLEALLAAGHISKADIEKEVSFTEPTGLQEYSTSVLLEEVSNRLEIMGEYAGWIRGIAHGANSPAGLGLDALRYVDPFTAPASADGMDFVQPLQPHVEEAGTIDDMQMYRLRKKNVGGPAQDELDEAAGESNIRHEEDEDDYTP